MAVPEWFVQRLCYDLGVDFYRAERLALGEEQLYLDDLTSDEFQYALENISSGLSGGLSGGISAIAAFKLLLMAVFIRAIAIASSEIPECKLVQVNTLEKDMINIKQYIRELERSKKRNPSSFTGEDAGRLGELTYELASQQLCYNAIASKRTISDSELAVERYYAAKHTVENINFVYETASNLLGQETVKETIAYSKYLIGTGISALVVLIANYVRGFCRKARVNPAKLAQDMTAGPQPTPLLLENIVEGSQPTPFLLGKPIRGRSSIKSSRRSTTPGSSKRRSTTPGSSKPRSKTPAHLKMGGGQNESLEEIISQINHFASNMSGSLEGGECSTVQVLGTMLSIIISVYFLVMYLQVNPFVISKLDDMFDWIAMKSEEFYNMLFGINIPNENDWFGKTIRFAGNTLRAIQLAIKYALADLGKIILNSFAKSIFDHNFKIPSYVGIGLAPSLYWIFKVFLNFLWSTVSGPPRILWIMSKQLCNLGSSPAKIEIASIKKVVEEIADIQESIPISDITMKEVKEVFKKVDKRKPCKEDLVRNTKGRCVKMPKHPKN